MNDKLVIIDYKAGNLTSVRLAFEALQAGALAKESGHSCPRYDIVISSDPDVISSASRVVFPGVGAASSAMANLKELGLIDVVRDLAGRAGAPRTPSAPKFLGICLGMQILFEHSEEDGGVDCLGVLPGKVKRFPNVPGFKVPEMGWNGDYYYVHSYYAELCPYTKMVTEYAGVKFTAMVEKGNLWACQFHPEKSGKVGLKLLNDWLLR